MEDRDFFDLLYQQWAKTTGAQDTYWMPQEAEQPYIGYFERGADLYEVYAVNQDGDKHPIGVFVHEADADFITGVHGCLPDLIRRLQDALDEADRLDAEKDDQEVRIAELEQSIDSLQSDVAEANSWADSQTGIVAELERENGRLQAKVEELEAMARTWGAPV